MHHLPIYPSTNPQGWVQGSTRRKILRGFLKSVDDILTIIADYSASNLHTQEQRHGVAIGCRVMLTANLDLTRGAANGATGVVSDMKSRNGGVTCIVVKLDAGGSIPVHRRFTQHGGRYHIQVHIPTVSLAYIYTMTGHKCQGATINTK